MELPGRSNMPRCMDLDLPSTRFRNPTRGGGENPKTIPLKKLVEQIQPSVLSNHLDRMVVFLKDDDKKDVSFPGIEPKMDAFLVRGMKDRLNLEGLLQLLDERSRQLAVELLELLKKNLHVYEVVHNYENYRANYSTLVFKKIYSPKPDPKIVKSPEESDEEVYLPPALKAQCLDTTLRFIKDAKTVVMNYPKMSIEEAEYVYALLRDPSEGGKGFQPLKDAVEGLNLMNLDFKISFMYLPHGQVQLVVEKVPMNNNQTLDNRSEPILTKAQKIYNNKKQLIGKIEHRFIRNSLAMVLEFLEDKQDKALVLRNADDDQSFLLHSLGAIVKNKKMHGLFDEECQQYLRQIGRLISNTAEFDLVVEISKIDRETKMRTVKILKQRRQNSNNKPGSQKTSMPSLVKPQGKENLQDVKTSTTDKKDIPMNVDIPKKDIPKSIDIPKKDIPKTADIPKKDIPMVVDIPKKDNKATENAASCSNVRSYRRPALASDRNATANPVPVDNKERPDSNVQLELRTQSDGRPLPKSKAKLLDDMSVPVESEKATRMMRQMGWEGGPLGTRGDGITEPIVPAIHMTARAGLGHVRPKKELTAAAAKFINFRLDLLKHILLLITEEPLKTTRIYPHQVSKKEKAFLQLAVKSFNSRNNFHLHDEPLQETMTAIVKEMLAEPKLHLSAVMADDKQSITLCKNKVPTSKPPQPPKPMPSPSPEAVFFYIARHARSCFITIDAVTKLGQDLMPGLAVKVARGLGCRVVVLARIYELVDSVGLQKVLTFETNLTVKQVTYITDVIDSFNAREKLSYSSAFENYIAVETIKVADDIQLNLTVADDNMSVTLQKKFYPKRRICAKDIEVASSSKTAKGQKATGKDDIHDTGIVIDLTDTDDEEKGSDKKAKDIVIRNYGACEDEPDVLNIKEFAKIKLDDEEAPVLKNEEAPGLENEEVPVLNNEEGKKNENDKTATDNEDNNSGPMKRARSDSEESLDSNKKTKLLIPKYLCIAPDSYPIEEISIETVQAFQGMICEKLTGVRNRSLIECLGVKNGALIYGCHNDIGISLVDGVAHELKLQTTNITKLYTERKRYKLSARFNSYLDLDVKLILKQLQDYNYGLKIDAWTVANIRRYTNYYELLIDIDNFSYEYIAQNSFSLFMGIDKIQFGIIWN